MPLLDLDDRRLAGHEIILEETHDLTAIIVPGTERNCSPRSWQRLRFILVVSVLLSDIEVSQDRSEMNTLYCHRALIIDQVPYSGTLATRRETPNPPHSRRNRPFKTYLVTKEEDGCCLTPVLKKYIPPESEGSPCTSCSRSSLWPSPRSWTKCLSHAYQMNDPPS